jgi:hypothetical protein
MAFSTYKTLGTVLQEYEVYLIRAAFVSELPFDVPIGFKEELELLFTEGAISSEASICEALIFPILKEVWKAYRQKFVLWSHEPLRYDETLSGVPDYTLAKRSRLGSIVFDRPYLLVVEAKQDDFTAGWAQCLAEMIAVQKLNGTPQQVIFGIVTNGRIWEFAKLHNSKFTVHPNSYSIGDLDRLFAVINFMFQECEIQLEMPVNN